MPPKTGAFPDFQTKFWKPLTCLNIGSLRNIYNATCIFFLLVWVFITYSATPPCCSSTELTLFSSSLPSPSLLACSLRRSLPVSGCQSADWSWPVCPGWHANQSGWKNTTTQAVCWVSQVGTWVTGNGSVSGYKLCFTGTVGGAGGEGQLYNDPGSLLIDDHWLTWPPAAEWQGARQPTDSPHVAWEKVLVFMGKKERERDRILWYSDEQETFI